MASPGARSIVHAQRDGFMRSHVSPHGDHLAATLYRLGVTAEQNGGALAQVYARIVSRLSAFVPVTDVKQFAMTSAN